MADFKWYEQRSFYWADGCDVDTPDDAEVSRFLRSLEADGWEDDPVHRNGGGVINMRRLYRPAIGHLRARINELPAQTVAEVAELGKVIHRIGTDVEWLNKLARDRLGFATGDQAKAAGGPTPSFGDLIDVEYPGASWMLNIRGGTK